MNLIFDFSLFRSEVEKEKEADREKRENKWAKEALSTEGARGLILRPGEDARRDWAGDTTN
jgi:hypothetical protein